MARKIRFEVGGLAVVFLAAVSATGPGAATASDLDVLVAQRMEVNESAAKSQGRIDELSEDNDKLTAEYRAILKRIDALRVYNHQVSELIASQDEEMGSLRRQIDDVELVGREITPLMLAMIDAVENFVELDVPFLIDERTTRMESLHEVMLRADVTDAERYRRIVEAYQIENEFGRTIEAYQGQIVDPGGKTRQVDYLRIGRVVFLYQTLDGLQTGVWDQKTKAWIDASDYDDAVRLGLRMARKQTAPDMLRLPVPAAEVAQ
jgi:FtsZ-binding cell division protein ZapB